MKKIILISPFSLPQNPRLVKEYEALKKAGYQVKVYYGERDKWASKFNHPNLNDFVLVGGSFGSFNHLLSRIIYKLLKPILPLAYSYNRISGLLLLKLLFQKADLYIGHNLASLPIVVKMAKFHHAKCGFDAEDFHRQETNDDPNSKEFRAISTLEEKYLKKVNYLTVASPLIGAAYQELFPMLTPLVINNVFSSNLTPSNAKLETKVSSGLKLFWFSQTIGRNRGLENVIIALGKLKQLKVSLTLLGTVRKEDRIYFDELILKENLQSSTIKFLKPVKPDQIFEIAAEHDIGLALEPGFCLNNKLALSNKLFTYIIAGIGIIATETEAQKQFLLKYPRLGSTFKQGDVDFLAELISEYYYNNKALSAVKLQASLLAKTELNWEIESLKFIHNIEKTLLLKYLRNDHKAFKTTLHIDFKKKENEE